MNSLSIPPAVGSDLSREVRGCRLAQQSWAARSVRDRLVPVRAFRRLLVAHAEDLAAALAKDLGKRADEALSSEVLPTADACYFLERQASRLLAPRKVPASQRPLWFFGQTDVVHRRPRGVVGVIGTWNYPLFLNAVQILQALTAGNGVLWKPSEVAPTLAALLGDLLQRAGYPAGLLHVLPATREMGAVLIEADIDFVVFTGSAATGRRVASRLGERLIPSALELSGCDCQFVLDDADVKLAARAAWFGVTVNRGQTCIAVRRAFVQRAVYSAFCDTLSDLAKEAAPLSLALPAQVAQADRLVADALACGGRLLVEGPVAHGEGGCRPAVVIDARTEMALCREASFAPVMAVLPFDEVSEAELMEAQCPYALGASVFTRSRSRAERLVAGLRAGSVSVNDVVAPTAHPGLPFGGRADSGWGVTRGAEGLLELTVPQVVSVRAGSFRPYYDLGKKDQGELVRALLQAGHGATLGERLGGWGKLLGLAWRGM